MLPPDKATEIDQLGFEPYVKGIESLIRGATSGDLPLAIGVYGPWGSGKSSFMKQLRIKLENPAIGHRSLPTVWFDAWKYDRIDDTRSALIYKILLELRKLSEADTSLKAKITDVLNDSSQLLLAFARRTHLKLSFRGLTAEFPSPDELVSEAESFQTSVDEFSETFAKLVKEFLSRVWQREDGKLVVFIDDLDRCLPENVISSLEALKLFLDEAPCVFILGLDRTIVEKAIQVHYGTDPGEMSRDYLDKIIQVPFVVPSATSGALKALYEPVVLDWDDGKFWQILEVGAHGNPRIYSRAVTAWKVVNILASNVGLGLDDDRSKHMLFMATIIQLRFPQLHEICKDHSEAFKYFYDRCRDNTWKLETNALDSKAALAFYPYWEDMHVRTFFQELQRVLGAADPMEDDTPPLFRIVFNLSGRGG